MINKINSNEVKKLICEFNNDFTPTLLSKERNIEIEYYCNKLSNNAKFVIEKDCTNKYIGFSAIYANNNDGIAYLILLAVNKKFRGIGYGHKILREAENIAINSGMKKIKLEVRNINSNAIKFYKKNGYKYCDDASKSSIYMIKVL